VVDGWHLLLVEHVLADEVDGDARDLESDAHQLQLLRARGSELGVELVAEVRREVRELDEHGVVLVVGHGLSLVVVTFY